MKYTKEETANARQFLLKNLKPGDNIQTILRHRSRSGMSRAISPVINGQDISWAVSRVLGESLDRNHGGIKIGGCGMDMGFHLVYSLSSMLFHDGFNCIGEDCPANDHHNKPYPVRKKNSMHHKDGGYAITQSWL